MPSLWLIEDLPQEAGWWRVSSGMSVPLTKRLEQQLVKYASFKSAAVSGATKVTSSDPPMCSLAQYREPHAPHTVDRVNKIRYVRPLVLPKKESTFSYQDGFIKSLC